MIDNLTDAIAHYKERARTYIDTLKPFGNKPLLESTKRYIARQQEFARKYEQLAAWLEELKERREEECPFTWDGDLDNKETIRLIREHMRIHSKKEPAVSARLNKAFLIAIEKLEADRWISVMERLPDKQGRCLVFTDYGDVTMDSFRDGMFVCNLGNVTHWKPLPHKPYESEAEK